MTKSVKVRDDSELPPKRRKAQQAREADFFASFRWKSPPTRDELDSEIQAQLRVIRSDKAALESGNLTGKDRDLLQQQLLVRFARVEELRKLKR